MSGGHKIYLSIENLKIDLENVAKANEADDKEDHDGDGTADVSKASDSRPVVGQLMSPNEPGSETRNNLEMHEKYPDHNSIYGSYQ